MEEFIKGYQWSPTTKEYMGEYVFPNNADKEEIHMPPFTTLVPPLICEKGFTSYWDGNKWNIGDESDPVKGHPPIDDYSQLYPETLDYLKASNLWTQEDEIKMQEALQNAKDAELEEIRINEEFEKNRDYLNELREIRDYLLTLSDWSQLPDVQYKFTSSKKEEWIEYREKLRNLPENIEDPKPAVLDLNHPSWPIRPEE